MLCGVAPEPGEYTFKLYLMSDSYLGCDQEYELQLKVGEPLEDDDEEGEEESGDEGAD